MALCKRTSFPGSITIVITHSSVQKDKGGGATGKKILTTNANNLKKHLDDQNDIGNRSKPSSLEKFLRDEKIHV
jgi:hypothetical protein